MYCRACKYPLRDLEEHRCPECGTAFDPENPESWLDAPHQSLRGLSKLLVLAVFLPYLPIGLLILTWIVAWLSLGHEPAPWEDDPKYINDGVSFLYRLTMMSLMLLPFLAVAGLIGVIVHGAVAIRQGDGIVRTFQLALLALTSWTTALILLTWDPLRMLDWLFD